MDYPAQQFEDWVAAIRKDISAFKLGWRWPRVIMYSVSLGRTDVGPLHQRAVDIYPPSEKSPINRDEIARKVFDHQLPSIGPLNMSREDPQRDSLFAAVRADLEPIVDAMIARATEAFEKKEIEAHNRKVRLLKLVEPIQEALWDGVTVEEITKLAKATEASGRTSRPTLEEVFACLAEDLKNRQPQV